MKLMLCTTCAQLVSMPRDGRRAVCMCGAAQGFYLPDRISARVTRDAIVFGADDTQFVSAVQKKTKGVRLNRIDVPCRTVDYIQEEGTN